tara:strand:+ start:768 stop:986 length:219 start_codon:yes stop_codon:yes gene_type:complete
VVTDLSEVVGRIWAWEARGVYLAVTVEPDCELGIVLGILHADRLGPEDHAWLHAHRECVTASVAALSELRVQ